MKFVHQQLCSQSTYITTACMSLARKQLLIQHLRQYLIRQKIEDMRRYNILNVQCPLDTSVCNDKNNNKKKAINAHSRQGSVIKTNSIIRL